jgi:general secretion pathway protein L
MAGTMLLRKLRGASDRYEWLLGDSGEESGEGTGIGTGSLDDAAAACAGSSPIMLAPGEDMLLTTVNVPARNRQRLLQALPYALEDRIAQDVEQMHFAPGLRHLDGSVPVAVLERQVLDQWLGELRAAGIEAARMIPDVLALPYQAGDWTLAIDGDMALLRTGPQRGLAIETDSLAAVLSAALDEAEDARPERLHVYAPQSDIAELEALATLGLELVPHPQSAPVLAMMAPQATTGEAIDLLQADYARRERLRGDWRRWRAAAITFAALVAVNLGMLTYDQIRLSRQSTQLQAEIESIYHQAFPETQRVVDPRVQMERGLASLRGGGAESGGFLDLMRAIAETISGTRGAVIQRIAYQDGRLDLSIHVPDLQQLDTMVRQLGEQGSVMAEIQSANAVGGRVEARLQVRPRQ